MPMASTRARFETPDSDNPTPIPEQGTFLLNTTFTLRELVFQDASQYPDAEARVSPLDRLPASFQELQVDPITCFLALIRDD